jgi:hypothetical protein
MKKIMVFAAVLLFLSAQTALADWMAEPVVFQSTYYADQNPDVENVDGYDQAKLLEHWKKFGINEGRRSSPVFDVKYYLQMNPDLARQFGQKNYLEAAKHWYNHGRKEGRASHPDFDVKIYLQKNPDVAKAVGAKNYAAAIDHYLAHGYMEGRKAK